MFKRKTGFGESKTFGSKKSFGPKSFGDRGPGVRERSFGDRDAVRPVLHATKCDECGQQCEVPFRPTGARPVLCKDCFRKQGGFSKQGLRERPSFRETPASGGLDTGRLEKRLEVLESKIDRVLRELEALKGNGGNDVQLN